ncbi:MAG TPA: hypothetical protein VGM53_33425 [Streptosporangiaceae bacterium]|jgi:hypothetical protein
MVRATGSTPLEQLADQLSHDGYATILTGGQAPTLRVVNRRAPGLAENIRTGDGWFCGAAGGLMAPCGDIPTAAQAVARMVGGRMR